MGFNLTEIINKKVFVELVNSGAAIEDYSSIVNGQLLIGESETFESRLGRLGFLRDVFAYELALTAANVNKSIVTTYGAEKGKRIILTEMTFSSNVNGFCFLTYDYTGGGNKLIPFFVKAGIPITYKGNGGVHSIASKPISLTFKPFSITPETGLGSAAQANGWIRYAEI